MEPSIELTKTRALRTARTLQPIILKPPLLSFSSAVLLLLCSANAQAGTLVGPLSDATPARN